jgi:hypothetical protein
MSKVSPNSLSNQEVLERLLRITLLMHVTGEVQPPSKRKKKYFLSVDISGEPWNLWIQSRQKQHIFDSNYKVFVRIIARGKEVQTSVCQMMIQRPWESMTSIHNSGKTC